MVTATTVDLNLDTEDLLPFNPILQQLVVKIKLTLPYPSDATFRYTISSSLYHGGTYVAKGHIDYIVKSGTIDKAYLVISRAAGGFCDTDHKFLDPKVVKPVTWTFGTFPFALVDGTEAEVYQCLDGTTESNWITTMKESGITHIRVAVNEASPYFQTQYMISPGELQLSLFFLSLETRNNI